MGSRLYLSAIAAHEFNFVVGVGVEVGGGFIPRGILAVDITGTRRGVARIGKGGVGIVVHWSGGNKKREIEVGFREFRVW